MSGMTEPVLIHPRKTPAHKYKPVLSRTERNAYAAAHRIITEQTNDPRLVCPGARRSAQVDAYARIIVQCFEETRKTRL